MGAVHSLSMHQQPYLPSECFRLEARSPRQALSRNRTMCRYVLFESCTLDSVPARLLLGCPDTQSSALAWEYTYPGANALSISSIELQSTGSCTLLLCSNQRKSDVIVDATQLLHRLVCKQKQLLNAECLRPKPNSHLHNLSTRLQMSILNKRQICVVNRYSRMRFAANQCSPCDARSTRSRCRKHPRCQVLCK